MSRGSSLNFAKESKAFAKALQVEHQMLGTLLESLDLAEKNSDGRPDPRAVKEAKAAHEAVRFQRTRTEAARGQQFDAPSEKVG